MRPWTVCPLCKNDGNMLVFRHRPARYIDGDVVRCTECGCMYKIPADLHKNILDYYNTNYAGEFTQETETEAEAEFDEILDFIAKERGLHCGRLIDLGCGPGRFLARARSNGYEVAGVEATDELAQRAEAISGARIYLGDVMDVALPEGAFDVVTALDLIEHVQDPVAMLKKYRRVLRPGGQIVVYTPNHASLIVRVANLIRRASLGAVTGPCDEIFDCMHVTFFDRANLCSALANAGFAGMRVKMIRYRPERRNQAAGAAAAVLKLIERVSGALHDGPFRTLAMAAPAQNELQTPSFPIPLS